MDSPVIYGLHSLDLPAAKPAGLSPWILTSASEFCLEAGQKSHGENRQDLCLAAEANIEKEKASAREPPRREKQGLHQEMRFGVSLKYWSRPSGSSSGGKSQHLSGPLAVFMDRLAEISLVFGLADGPCNVWAECSTRSIGFYVLRCPSGP
jgi:hypothetical protein